MYDIRLLLCVSVSSCMDHHLRVFRLCYVTVTHTPRHCSSMVMVPNHSERSGFCACPCSHKALGIQSSKSGRKKKTILSSSTTIKHGDRTNERERVKCHCNTSSPSFSLKNVSLSVHSSSSSLAFFLKKTGTDWSPRSTMASTAAPPPAGPHAAAAAVEWGCCGGGIIMAAT
jgi:hypothetical protein